METGATPVLRWWRGIVRRGTFRVSGHGDGSFAPAEQPLGFDDRAIGGGTIFSQDISHRPRVRRRINLQYTPGCNCGCFRQSRFPPDARRDGRGARDFHVFHGDEPRMPITTKNQVIRRKAMKEGEFSYFRPISPDRGPRTYFSGWRWSLLPTAEDYYRFCQMMLNNGKLLWGTSAEPQVGGADDHRPRAGKIDGMGYGLGFGVAVSPGI